MENPHIQEKILDGSFDQFESLSQESCEFIKSLQIKTNELKDQVSMNVTLDNIKDWARGLKEDKSGAPSGLFPGMFKTISQIDDVLMIFIHIINISIELSYVLKRWSNVHQIFMEKVENIPWIHKFRNIQLIEHDLNFFLSLIWANKLPKFFEKHNLLQKTQKGSRTRRNTHEMLFNKIYTYDICRMMRMTAAFQENDGTNCYDRAILAIAEISMRRLGLDVDAAKYQSKILKSFVHRAITSTGVSRKCWQYDVNFKIFGTGQGLGWSSVIWIGTNDIISVALYEKQRGISFISPTGYHTSDRPNDAYVDDVAIGITGKKMESPEVIKAEMQKL